MPRYEYKCEKCDNTITINSTSYDPMKYCSAKCQCGGKMKSILNAPAVHLKGNGWAKDGYSSTSK
jgi:putative FmdB family regulatory protein